jgi:asparagine synthase (glutamine-hydrolysing)
MTACHSFFAIRSVSHSDRKARRLSGIVGIYHRNGAPLEQALLQSLVDFLSYRGPDSRECWMDGSIGLGHAMLRTTHESLGERQPASLDGRFWIAADARLDGRAEFISELQRAGRAVRPNAPDSELILQAYATWGTPCVERLRGDFSFAIWDARNKQLFCARDHFGIKPFYYVQRGDLFLFSNTLNCVRMHPEVSDELNEAAIGDFLLFGLNCDNATTSFRDIQRLPPAHSLSISPEGLKIRRYWAPPTDGRIRYSKPEEYVENFQSLLEAAVADRLRTDRVGILLSGGLDSSSVAAVAKEVCGKSSQATELRGYTYIYESLIPDREGDYAREVGEFLRVPIKFLAMDQVQLFEGWGDPEFSLPEPVEDPLFAGFLDSCRNISAHCCVLLSGEGCDNLMGFQMWPYAGDLWRRGEWQRLLTEMTNYLWVRPFPWRGIRARFLRLIGKDPVLPVFPQWLAADFAQRMKLQERWEEWGKHPKLTLEHPIHPKAHASLSLPHWTQMFEQGNAGWTPYPLEVRYPFMDLRIVNYLLSLPPFPWFFEKMLLREAMAERIPERVRMRPKTPLQGDPVSAQLHKAGAEGLNKMHWSKDSDRFIEGSALVPLHGMMSAEQIRTLLRPYCLNIWLQSARRVGYIHAEAGNG